MHILITGGAGFIGSHLADALLMQGHNVTILDDLSSGKVENISKKCQLVVGDINDTSLLETIFDKIDCCYHLAAIPSVQKSEQSWLHCHKVNLTGTINVFLQASQRKIPVIYASSAAVYGNSADLPLSEYTKGTLISPYGVDKYSCELQAKVFSHVHGLKTIGLRFFNVYGSRQDPNSPYSGVISIFIDNINNGKPLLVFGDGSQERDFIFIDDVVEALTKAKDHLSDQPKIYNVCTGRGVQINSLIENLFAATDKKLPVNYLARRDGDIYKSIGNPWQAKDKIGFEAQVPLLDGLKSLIKNNSTND